MEDQRWEIPPGCSLLVPSPAGVVCPVLGGLGIERLPWKKLSGLDKALMKGGME